MDILGILHTLQNKFVQAVQSAPSNMTTDEAAFLSQKMIFVNLKRIIPMQVILLVFQTGNLCIYKEFPRSYSNHSNYIIFGSIFLICVALLSVPFVIMTLNRKQRNLRVEKWLYRCFWSMVVIGFFPYIFLDTVYRHSITNIILFLFLMALVPILKPREMLAIIALLTAFVTIVVLYFHQKPYIIGQCILLSLTATFFAKTSFNTYCRTVVTELRLNKAVDALRESNRQLTELSETDTLSNLLNRRGMEKKLEFLWPHIIGHQEIVYGILFDIDFFKDYNDCFGHVAGDECLCRVAAVMQAHTEHVTDIIARYGGEEFVIIINNGTWEDVQKLAEHIKEKIEGLQIPSAETSVSPYVTVSAGIFGMKPTFTDTPRDLVLYADQALYKAKKAGRNCIVADNTFLLTHPRR